MQRLPFAPCWPWAAARRMGLPVRASFRDLVWATFALGLAVVVLSSLAHTVSFGQEADGGGQSWRSGSPRDEIGPYFRIDPEGGPKGSPALVIWTDERPGLDGWWRKRLQVKGGHYYRFHCLRQMTGEEIGPQECFVQIYFRDAQGRSVPGPHGYPVESYFPEPGPVEEGGWQEIRGTFLAPKGATLAELELRLRWARRAAVRWADVRFEEVEGSPQRRVRLGAVHHRPQGTQHPSQNYEQFGKLLSEAAQQRADLVVLPECINYYGMARCGKSMADVAEAIPGPATDYFGRLAAKHDLYVVVPIIERDGHLLYNSAALVGPEGTVVGKYHKVCLPSEEYNQGLCAGREYPVFQTRFGRLGIMICWDIHFPEVARELWLQGAEVLAVPIWGGMPDLAKARALENQVYLVTSTYSDPKDNWMVTGIWEPTGERLVEARTWGTVVVAEVDLAARHISWYNIGDFKSRILHERPREPRRMRPLLGPRSKLPDAD